MKGTTTMSQRLIKPGLSVAAGTIIGYRKDGRPITVVAGAAPDVDDPDDPTFTGTGGTDDDDDSDDDEDDESEQDEDEDDVKSKKKPAKKAAAKKASGKKADDDEDDEDDEDKPVYTEYEYQRVRTRMRKADQRASALQQENDDLKARLRRGNGDKGKQPARTDDDVDTRDRADRERREADDKHKAEIAAARMENAFLKANTIDWTDSEDALAVGQRLGLFEDVLDDDGTVDRRAMVRALRELAKRKPHLVKPKVSDQDDEDDDDEEPVARRTAKMNGKRKGSSPANANRAALESKFPALKRR